MVNRLGEVREVLVTCLRGRKTVVQDDDGQDTAEDCEAVVHPIAGDNLTSRNRRRKKPRSAGVRGSNS